MDKINELVSKYKEKTEKECYRVDITSEEASILDNKIGGIPYLPIGEEYPTDKKGNKMALLLQVDLEEIDLPYFNSKDILEIFIDYKTDWPVEYEIKLYPKGLDYQTDIIIPPLDEFITRKGYKISLTKDKCYMSVSDYRFSHTLIPIVNEVYDESLDLDCDIYDYFENDEIDSLYNIASPQICIGGYPDFTQTDPRCYSDKNLDENLFKLDSCGEYDYFNIGDSGILFCLISPENLKNNNFKEAFVDWDCC